MLTDGSVGEGKQLSHLVVGEEGSGMLDEKDRQGGAGA